MDVASIMSPDPISVTLDTPVQDARTVMDNKGIRHLPVTAHGRVIAMLADRDLYPTVDEFADVRSGRPARTVADVVQARLTAVSPDDSAVSAAAQCRDQEGGCVPVMSGTQLVGILSEMDLLTAFTTSVPRGDEGGDVPSVDDLMTPFPLVATPQTTVADAIGMCRSLRAHHLPVVDGETLVGIVSDRDLLCSAAAGRAHEGKLGEIMQDDPITIGPRHPSAEAAVLMSTAKVSALPVVENGELIGIVTLTDLLAHMMTVLGRRGAQVG